MSKNWTEHYYFNSVKTKEKTNFTKKNDKYLCVKFQPLFLNQLNLYAHKLEDTQVKLVSYSSIIRL